MIVGTMTTVTTEAVRKNCESNNHSGVINSFRRVKTMNSIHLEQVFANYIEKFEWLNEPTGNNEVYKWKIAQGFRSMRI